MTDSQPNPGSGGSGDSPSDDENRQTGKLMIIGVWVLLLGLLTWFAHRWYEKSENPNQTVYVGELGCVEYVQRKANRAGHDVANGRINGTEVVFLLDTGATSISIPSGVAKRIGIEGVFLCRYERRTVPYRCSPTRWSPCNLVCSNALP